MKIFTKILLFTFFATQFIYANDIESETLHFALNGSKNKISTTSNFKILKYLPDDKSIAVSDFLTMPVFDNAPFIGVGAKWKLNTVGSEINISLQYIDVHGKESGWLAIDVDEDIGRDGYEIAGSLVFLPNDAQKFRLRLKSENFADINNVSLSFINPGISNHNTEEALSRKRDALKKTTDDFELPPVVSRTEWGCPDGQGSRWTPRYTDVTHLIVHHSATENSSSDWAAVVRTFWHWHTIDNGWGDIGYNFLVDPDGVVYEGRSGGNNAMGAHFCGTNSNTMGVCVIGNFTSVTPKNAAIASLVKVLSWKCNLDSIDPLGRSFHSSSGRTLNRISGHRDGCSTACPGNLLYNMLGSVRSDVSNLLSGKGPVVTNYPANEVTSGYPAYKPFEISFTQSMDQLSVENAISIVPDGSVMFTWSGAKVISIEPLTQWNFSGTYELTIDTSAKSLFGGTIDGDNDGEPGGKFIHIFNITDPDAEPPYITKGFPVGNDININSEMTFYFNEEVDGIIGRISLRDTADNIVSLADGKIINENFQTFIAFRSFSPLNPLSEYRVLLNAGISDFYGNAMSADTIISFYTDDGQYPVGNILYDFNDDADILDPAQNAHSEFFVGASTSFRKSGTKAIEGEIAGRLNYEFEPDVNAKVYVEFLNPLSVTEEDSVLSLWVYGDFSGNVLAVHFDEYDQNVFSIDSIDWYGWDVFEIRLSELTVFPSSVHGISVSSNEGAKNKGQLYFDELLSVSSDITTIDDKFISPDNFYLAQNYPNPFNPVTRIEYKLPAVEAKFESPEPVTLKIYDILGRLVTTLVNEYQEPGNYTVSFDSSELGRRLSSGVYFYTLKYGEFKATKKMLMLN